MKTTKRFEYKYVISYADYFKIKDLIAGMLEHDQHGDEVDYPVNSIYLDDIVYTGASDKAFGHEVHQKYRIRFYERLDQMKLELKQKIGDVSTKFSTPINQEIYEGIMTQNLDVFQKYIDDKLIRRYMVDMLKNNLEPKVTINYKREAYKDSTDNLRVTFDHSLFGDWFHEDDFKSSIQLLSSNKLIMEVKYEFYLPENVKIILDKIKPEQVAYSKYFLGYISLGI